MTGIAGETPGTAPRLSDLPGNPGSRLYLHIERDTGGLVAGFAALRVQEERVLRDGTFTVSRTLSLRSAGVCPEQGKRLWVSAPHEHHVLGELVRAAEGLAEIVTAHGYRDEIALVDSRLEDQAPLRAVPFSWHYACSAALGPDETLGQCGLSLGLPLAPYQCRLEPGREHGARLEARAAVLLCVHQHRTCRGPGGEPDSRGELAEWIRRDPDLAPLRPLARAITRSGWSG